MTEQPQCDDSTQNSTGKALASNLKETVVKHLKATSHQT